MTILIPCEQGSEEWLRARAGACTASRFTDARSRMKANRGSRNVGDMTGECESYAQLLAIERIAGEPLDSTFETWAMRRGRELEPVARALYEERTGTMVEESGVALTDDYWFGYSTDGGAFGQPGGIEIKCPVASEKVAGVWLHPESVIEEYLNQIDGGMWINHWQWIDLVVYTPWLESVGKDLFIRRIHRSEERIDALVADLMAFIRVVNAYEAQLRGIEAPPLFEAPPWVTEEAPAAPAKPAATTKPAALAEPAF